MVKKTLVFRFFVPKEYKENIAIRMHLECLKRYSHIFDAAIFSICFEDDDMSLACDVERDILDCGFSGDVRFVLEENSPYTESIALKKYVIDELKDIEGIVLFAHTKGVINVKTYADDIDNKLKWIYCLYFYNLEFVDDVIENLIFCKPHVSTFYGALMTTFDEGKTFHYPGTFYWVNPANLYNDVESGFVKIPQLSNRAYAENLPFIYTRTNTCHATASHNDAWMTYYDLYHGDMNLVVKFFGDYDLYMERYNEIRKIIGYEG